jgi:hypothetical protein
MALRDRGQSRRVRWIPGVGDIHRVNDALKRLVSRSRCHPWAQVRFTAEVFGFYFIRRSSALPQIRQAVPKTKNPVR